jgi:hypothetical protein
MEAKDMTQELEPYQKTILETIKANAAKKLENEKNEIQNRQSQTEKAGQANNEGTE